MRRDCVTQVIVRWRDGEEDMQGRKKWDYRLVEDEEGRLRLMD